MTKEEAAKFLGCSPRQIERYVAENRIGVVMVKGKTRPTPTYDEAELARLKAELHRPTHRPAVERVGEASREMATGADNGLALLSQASQLEGFTRFIVETMKAAQPSAAQAPSIADIAAKPLLTLAEAQLLTGLSRDVLRGAISSGALDAKQIGRAWRIKRAALDAYIGGL